MPIPTEVKATVRSGYRLTPQSRILWGGTLATISGIDIGFTAGTGIDLGILSSLGFNYRPNFVPISGPSLMSASLIEISDEELEITASIYDFNTKFLEDIFPASRPFYDFAATGTSALIMPIGRNYNGGNVKPLVIEFTNTLQPLSPGVLENGISGGILTIYRALITGGFNFNLDAKRSNIVQLTFQALYDYNRQKKEAIGSLYYY